MEPVPLSPRASEETPTTITMLVGDSQIDRRVLDQARTLIQAGCRVTVLAGPASDSAGPTDEDVYPDVPIRRIDPARKVDSYSTDDDRLPDGLRRDFSRIFPHHDGFLELALENEANVYTAHDLPQLPAAGIAAAVSGAYLVYDAHELFPERQFFPQDTISFLQDIERGLAPLADLVTTVNTSLAEIMAIRYGIEVPRVVLNCPAVHGNDLPIVHDDEIRRQLNLGPEARILLYQGGLHDHRNLQQLVPAMSRVSNDDVVLVLMGNGGLRPALEETAEACGILGRRVFFLDAVPQHELLRYTASADCGIIPYPHVDLNTYFCTPNKLFEFMVAGLPILANDSPELNRFVSRQGIGLNLPMRTEAGIAEAIDEFFEGDVDAWKGRVRTLSEGYTWSAESSKLLEAYGALITTVPQAGVRMVLLGARANFAAGDRETTTAKLEALLQADPGNIDVLNTIADIAFNEGEMRVAVEAARQVLARDDRNRSALTIVKHVKEYTDRARLLEAM